MHLIIIFIFLKIKSFLFYFKSKIYKKVIFILSFLFFFIMPEYKTIRIWLKPETAIQVRNTRLPRCRGNPRPPGWVGYPQPPIRVWTTNGDHRPTWHGWDHKPLGLGCKIMIVWSMLESKIVPTGLEPKVVRLRLELETAWKGSKFKKCPNRANTTNCLVGIESKTRDHPIEGWDKKFEIILSKPGLGLKSETAWNELVLETTWIWLGPQTAWTESKPGSRFVRSVLKSRATESR